MNCRRSGRWAQRLVESVASRPTRAGLGGNRESGVSGGCGGFVNAGATAGRPAKFPPEPFPAFRVSAVLLRTHRDQAADALREELRKARYYFDQTRSKGEGARNRLGEGLSYKSPRLLARLDDFAQKIRPVFRRPPRRRKGKKESEAALSPTPAPEA